MDEEKMSNEKLLRELDLHVEGCPDAGCRACAANERLLHELAKRLGIPDYVTVKQGHAKKIERRNRNGR